MEVSYEHPVGVEVTYRKYVSDEYPEVVEDPDPNSDLGVKIEVIKSITHPVPGAPPVNCLLGIPGIFINLIISYLFLTLYS